MNEFLKKFSQCVVDINHNTCNDDLNPNIGLNKLFIQSSIHRIYSSEIGVISVPLGIKRLINLLFFITKKKII